MRRRKPYTHLVGSTAYYPFGARAFLRKKQRRRAWALRGAGALFLTIALALVLRQTAFRGGQPSPEPLPENAPTSAVWQSQTQETAQSILPQYRSLYAQNHDLIGWLRLPGTNIDYPVMQTPAENTYYLRRGFDGFYATSGSLFLDASCKIGPEPTANWIIYGHNMADGSMFGALNAYANQAFWAEHPTFVFDTLYEEGQWQVIAAFRATVGQDKLPYYTFFDADNAEDWQQHYDAIVEKSLYDTGCSAQYGDQLLTLSTCGTSSSLTDSRFALLAKRIN